MHTLAEVPWFATTGDQTDWPRGKAREISGIWLVRIVVGSSDTVTEGFSYFLQPFQPNAGRVCRLGHDHFLPNYFQFIIHLHSYNRTLRILDNESVR
jgi:hypothetical protein